MGGKIYKCNRKKSTRTSENKSLDKYNRLPYNYESKIEYVTLIQNVILKELINLMVATIPNIDIELKVKINRLKNLESRLL